MRRLLTAVGLLVALSPGPTRADQDGWTLTVEPYAWLPFDITGELTVGDVNVPFEVDPSAVFDRLELGVAGRIEAWYRRLGLIGDFQYLRLGEEGTVRGTPYDATLDELLADAILAWRLAQFGDRPPGAPGAALELGLGLRTVWISGDASLGDNSAEDSVVVPRPVVMLQVPIRLAERLALRVRGQATGPILWGWTVLGLLEVDVSRFALELGYRYDGVRYDGDDPVELDLDAHGPYLGLGIRFGGKRY